MGIESNSLTLAGLYVFQPFLGDRIGYSRGVISDSIRENLRLSSRKSSVRLCPTKGTLASITGEI